jgi:hypothetical protein
LPEDGLSPRPDDIWQGHGAGDHRHHQTEEEGEEEMSETRKPTFIQNINGWMTPILVGVVIAVAGFIALEAVQLGKTVSTIGTIQTEVRANQSEMKSDIKEIRVTVEKVSEKLDTHMVVRDANSKIHHRTTVTPCNKCHDK